MKIRTSYPGQDPVIIDAPAHIEQILMNGGSVPFIIQIEESDRHRQLSIDDVINTSQNTGTQVDNGQQAGRFGVRPGSPRWHNIQRRLAGNG